MSYFIWNKNLIRYNTAKKSCRISVYILLLLIASCSQTPNEQIELLNGYWEIANIENSHGSSKEYSISQNIDFFEVNKQGKGLRKKVQPDIKGNFTTTNSSQNIDVITKNNIIFLNYSTAHDTWQEEVITVSKKELTLRNQDNFTYVYRRYKPLSLD